MKFLGCQHKNVAEKNKSLILEIKRMRKNSSIQNWDISLNEIINKGDYVRNKNHMNKVETPFSGKDSSSLEASTSSTPHCSKYNKLGHNVLKYTLH